MDIFVLMHCWERNTGIKILGIFTNLETAVGMANNEYSHGHLSHDCHDVIVYKTSIDKIWQDGIGNELPVYTAKGKIPDRADRFRGTILKNSEI